MTNINKFQRKSFTIVEVLIAVGIISMSLYGFNMSLVTSRRSVILAKTQLSLQTIAHDYAKRMALCSFEQIDGFGDNLVGTIPDTILAAVIDTSIDYYDMTPQITDGSYTILITPFMREVDTVDINGAAIKGSVEVAKKITVLITANLNIPGMSEEQYNDSTTVYVYAL